MGGRGLLGVDNERQTGGPFDSPGPFVLRGWQRLIKKIFIHGGSFTIKYQKPYSRERKKNCTQSFTKPILEIITEICYSGTAMGGNVS